MCIETIELRGKIHDREAYEIGEVLKGVKGIESATCDVTTSTVTVDYEEDEIDHKGVLDYLELFGFTPVERHRGWVGKIGNAVLG